jgi:hypothetical protein
MVGTGTSTGRATGLALTLVLFALLLGLVLLGAWPADLQGQELASLNSPSGQPGAEIWPIYPVAFVGKDHVDLKWDLYADYPTYQVYRGGIKIAEYGIAPTFHRDEDVGENATYTYQVCAVKPGQPDYCSFVDQETVGRIEGHLYQDLTWPGGEYQLR